MVERTIRMSMRFTITFMSFALASSIMMLALRFMASKGVMFDIDRSELIIMVKLAAVPVGVILGLVFMDEWAFHFSHHLFGRMVISILIAVLCSIVGTWFLLDKSPKIANYFALFVILLAIAEFNAFPAKEDKEV